MNEKLMEEIINYIKSCYGVEIEEFFNSLKSSPSAEGYILGTITEAIFKKTAEEKGYDVLRIKEKPEGGHDAKKAEARGDFYIRKKGNTKNEWLVIECKNLKSNAEKRSNYTSVNAIQRVLLQHTFKRDDTVKSKLTNGQTEYNKAKSEWEKINHGKQFPDFNWNSDNPAGGIPDLKDLWENVIDLENWVRIYNDDHFSEDAHKKRKSPFRLLQTHMPTKREDNETGLIKTGPLVSDFNIVCVDLFIKTREHKLIYANAKQLNHQAASPNHLQQNYTIDILIEKDSFELHKLLKPWYDDLELCIKETQPIYRTLEEDQLDTRENLH